MLFILFFIGTGSFFFLTRSSGDFKSVVKENISPTQAVTPKISKIKTPPGQYEIDQARFVSQTFNNCGPASLSMIMSHFGKDIDQGELASIMRPFNNPAGGVDDKSVTASEFVETAKMYGFESLHRPNGDEEMLKRFIANEIPVVVRTWLHPNEDIGHFRIVRGYDDTRRIFIQDDSYEGANLEYDYKTFLSMWKPFNYGYILVYPKEKKEIVNEILGTNIDEKTAFKNALVKAEKERNEGIDDAYTGFNLATAHYYLGNYQKSIEEYEKVERNLPPRMLWYQYEIVDAYRKVKQFDKVISIATDILSKDNQAYTEMYLFRGYVYQEQGDINGAREEFEKALFYNKNSVEAERAIENVKI